jgi:hypothetical protein
MKKKDFHYLIYKNKNKNMKTKVEVLGYEIEIEEVDGVVTVKADLDGETVEEFTLETPGEEVEGQSDDDVKGFKDFEGQAQEEDFPQEEEESQNDDDDDDDEKQLESFQSFINKK